jgi:signal transduction histidine kinase
LDPKVPVTAADPHRVLQAITNLVNNGIKFNREGGMVEIRTRDESDSLLLEVRDNGPGVQEDEMDKLFVKYARLSSKPTGGEKSSGLGLAIARLLVELHQGEIGARRNPEGGMTFWFRLPKTPVDD